MKHPSAVTDTTESAALNPGRLQGQGQPLPDGEDDRARRRYAIWSAVLGIFVQLYFVIYNTLRGAASLETVLDFASVCTLGGALALLHFSKWEKAAYRLGIGTAIAVCSYTVLFPLSYLAGSILSFFVVPTALFYILGLREGLWWYIALALLVGLICIFPQWFGKEPLSTIFIFRYLSSFLVFSGFSATLEWFRSRSWAELHQADAALQKATVEQKAIEGLVPICSYCKKILDEKGYWRQLEGFLQKNTSAHVSSGLCEVCAAEKEGERPSGGFAVPVSLAALFSWKSSYEALRRKFVVYGGIVAVALLWAFAVREIAVGLLNQAVTQIGVSLVLMVLVWMQFRSRRPPWLYWAFCIAHFFLMIQPFFDEHGEVSEIFWFFLFPLVASFLLGFTRALLATTLLFAYALWVLFADHLIATFGVSEQLPFFFILSFLLVSILALNLERLRARYARALISRLETLESTYQNIRTIKGLVPVCRECKSIRNDKGFWTNFEKYFMDHTQVTFSHGICERCLEQIAPDVFEEIKKDN